MGGWVLVGTGIAVCIAAFALLLRRKRERAEVTFFGHRASGPTWIVVLALGLAVLTTGATDEDLYLPKALTPPPPAWEARLPPPKVVEGAVAPQPVVCEYPIPLVAKASFKRKTFRSKQTVWPRFVMDEALQADGWEFVSDQTLRFEGRVTANEAEANAACGNPTNVAVGPNAIDAESYIVSHRGWITVSCEWKSRPKIMNPKVVKRSECPRSPAIAL